jgi:multiple sugar transport system substrate-binding protein
MKSKKVMSLVLTGLLASSLFAGCAKQQPAKTGGDTPAVTDETKLKGEIEMWSTFTDIENKVLTDKVVPAFIKNIRT